MTKTEFKLFEKVCKKMWRELAETGNTYKPGVANCFMCHCPACHIVESLGEASCRSCPIEAWRSRDGCDGSHLLYRNWFNEPSADIRKKYAKAISKAKWVWLDKYKKANVREDLLETSRKYLEAT